MSFTFNSFSFIFREIALSWILNGFFIGSKLISGLPPAFVIAFTIVSIPLSPALPAAIPAAIEAVAAEAVAELAEPLTGYVCNMSVGVSGCRGVVM